MTDTPNTTQGKGAVDWSRPIEAVHEDGRVVAVHLGGEDENPDKQGDHYTLPSLNGDAPGIWQRDGTSWMNADAGWRVRNVPEHPTPTQYAPELVERMVALMKAMTGKTYMQPEHYEEARSIVSDLPQKVDPDLIEARERLNLSFVPCTDEAEALALACIKRGRQLERGESA